MKDQIPTRPDRRLSTLYKTSIWLLRDVVFNASTSTVIYYQQTQQTNLSK